MKTETETLLDRLLQEDLFVVWEHAKTGKLADLDTLDQQMAGIMLEHKEIYFEAFENPREESLEECSAENGIDPYMHVIIHLVIENQLKDNDPPGINDLFEEMKGRNYEEREIKEMFAAVFEGELHKLNGRNKQFDRDFYLKTLKAIK